MIHIPCDWIQVQLLAFHSYFDLIMQNINFSYFLQPDR